MGGVGVSFLLSLPSPAPLPTMAVQACAGFTGAKGSPELPCSMAKHVGSTGPPSENVAAAFMFEVEKHMNQNRNNVMFRYV